MTIYELLVQLAQIGLGAHPSDEDALAVMVLLHTHEVRLSGFPLSDRPKVDVLAAIARQHAAELVSAVWPDRADQARTSRQYWHGQFMKRTPWELAEEIATPWDEWMNRDKASLIESSVVKELRPED
jgi:hypothetical protein